jgi:hypothetical protein
VTVAIDVELGPDNKLYVATHGRGIWRIDSPVAAPPSAAAMTTSTTSGSSATGTPGGGKRK